MFQDIKITNAVPDTDPSLYEVSAVDATDEDEKLEIEEVLLPKRKCGWFPNGNRLGLKGGAPGRPSNKPIQNSLRLINNRSEATRNICFANSIIQLMQKSGYALLLRTQFQQFIAGKPDIYQGCKALYSLYCEQSNRERSAASVRKLVAQKSGKDFLDNKQQQDSEEFLRALITMMTVELEGWDAFNMIHNEHIGKEKIKRKFIDNASGVCSRCGEFPSCTDQEFKA